MTTTEMTTTTGNQLAVANEPFDNGLGELSAGDLIIPRLSITQPTTPDIDAANAGKFTVNLTGEFHEQMGVAIIKLSKSRILFPEKYKRDNDPLCRSHNFLTPANDIPGATPMAESCGTVPGDPKKHICPYANWGKDNTAPRCQECWNLLVVDLESYMPMWFTLKSTALKPLRKIVSAISIISQAKRIPMWGMRMEMALKKETNDSGTFYIPVFSGPTTLSAEEAEVMGAIRQQLVHVDVKDSVEAVREDAPQTAAVDDTF